MGNVISLCWLIIFEHLELFLMYIILNLVNASSVISHTTETTFTPILLPAITRTLLLPHFWHNYYEAQEETGTSS